MAIVVNNCYKNAYYELYEIIKHLTIVEQSKIPNVFIKNLQSQMIENKFVYDDKKDITNQNIMPETKALLVEIYKKYLSTEEEKNILNKYESLCTNAANKEKEQKYNSDIFNKESSKSIQRENAGVLLEIKNKSFISKIFEKIKSFFFRS